jgi:hypothetical protein
MSKLVCINRVAPFNCDNLAGLGCDHMAELGPTCSIFSHSLLKIIASKPDTSVHLSTEEIMQIRA